MSSSAPVERDSPHDERRLASPIRRVWRLCIKELRETLRDRRTMVTLILMPLIVYPLLSIIFQRFLIETYRTTQKTKCIVGTEHELEGNFFGSLVVMTKREFEKTRSPTDEHHEAGLSLTWASTDWLDREIELAVVDDLQQAVRSEVIDVGIRIEAPQEVGAPPRWVEIIHRPLSHNSRIAREAVENYLNVARDSYIQGRLRGTGRATLPIQMRFRAIESKESNTVSLATLIPLILVLMTVTGAVYPAIDLTAGERERGTMEALIAAPVPRMGLLFAKYVAVVTVAILTATANLVAMTLTLWSSGVGKTLFGTNSVSIQTLLAVFGLMVLFAGFFSSVLLTVTSFARSFKEAQAYLIPLILLSLGPSLICLAPGVELNGLLAVTPLINIVLLARNALEGQPFSMLAALCVISTLLYAAAALAIAAKVFGSDAILYGSPTGWRDVFQRADQARAAPTLASALGTLAILFPMYVIVVGLLGQMQEASLSLRLLYTAAITLGLFGLLPLCVSHWGNVVPWLGFRLRSADWWRYIGCALLGLSIWPMLQQLVLSQGSTSEEQFALVESFRDQARELGPVLILCTMAIVPAIFEELFFRGFLFSALRERISAQKTVVLTALLFGAFHVLAKHALATERFLPTACMGLILGWVCWMTGSVLPGILLHAVHNGTLLLMFYYRDELAARGFGAIESDVVPTSWLLFSAAGMAMGALLVLYKRRA